MQKDKIAEPLPEIGFIRLSQVLHILGGISKSAFYAGVQGGVYPAPKRLTARTVVWNVKEIKDFIERVSNNNQDSQGGNGHDQTA